MALMDEERELLKSDDDVDEILKIAVRKQGGSDLTLRERLQASAEELGISDSALAQAEQEYLQKRAEEEEFLEFKRKQRREFREHLMSFVIVNAFLVTINFWTSGTVSWAVWPILGWGIGLAFHSWRTLNSDSQSFQQEFEAYRRKQARRRERNL